MCEQEDASRMDDDRARGAGGGIAMKAALRPRFVIASAVDASGVAEISGAELHHMRDVLRLSVSAGISNLDTDGPVHFRAIARYERERSIVKIESSRSARTYRRIILAIAIF